MSVVDDLRIATGDAHRQIEASGLARRMMTGQIERGEYVALLADLYQVHAIWELRLAETPALKDRWPATPSRAEAIRRDLAYLGRHPIGPVPNQLREWDRHITAANRPAAWAGAGYVLEGSRLGARMLAKPLAQAFQVEPGPGVGLDYLLDHGPDFPARWRQVLTALEQLGQRPEDRSAMIAAAIATFSTLHELYRRE